MSDWYYMNVVLIQTTLTTLLLALSIQVPLRFGVFSFAGIGAFGIGGYGAAMAMVHLEWSTWPVGPDRRWLAAAWSSSCWAWWSSG